MRAMCGTHLLRVLVCGAEGRSLPQGKKEFSVDICVQAPMGVERSPGLPLIRFQAVDT